MGNAQAGCWWVASVCVWVYEQLLQQSTVTVITLRQRLTYTKVGISLSPLLFAIVMEAMSREFTDALPWKLLCADDLVTMAKSEELIKKLNL